MPSFKIIKSSELGDFGLTLNASFWCLTEKKVRDGVKKLSEFDLNDYLVPFKKLGPTAHRFVKLTLVKSFGANFEGYYDSFVEHRLTSRPISEKRLLVVALFTLRSEISEAIEQEYERVVKLEKELKKAMKNSVLPKNI